MDSSQSYTEDELLSEERDILRLAVKLFKSTVFAMFRDSGFL